MKFTKPLSYLLTISFLTGCATGYHGSGITGGFSEKQLPGNITKVTFQGNGFSTAPQTYQYAMRRSAELTLSKGHQYFEVVGKRNYLTTTTNVFAGPGPVPIPITSTIPATEINVRFVDHKTATAYDAKKVLAQTTN